MADKGTSVGACDNSCGCPTPCPGGDQCRCKSSGRLAETQHNYCQCGSHCSCNPCSCSTTEVPGSGMAFCKCQEGCTCSSCKSV